MNWMNQWKTRRYAVVGGIATVFSMSGCFATNQNGFELTASLGAHAVHDYSESQKTYSTPPCAGIKAWWYGCGNEARPAGATTEEAHS